METLKGLCVGFHALFRRGSFGLRILIAAVTIGICSSAWADTEAHKQAAEQVLKLTNVGSLSQWSDKLNASVFSEKELGELVQVFKSSIGQKMMEKNPNLMHVVMLRGQNRLMKIIPRMQAISDEMMRELRERVYE